MKILIGRERELSVLDAMFTSEKSEFVAVYGRRRVGKTFLIRSAFQNKITFQITGLANASLSQQLSNFHLTLSRHNPKTDFTHPGDWLNAFSQLSSYLESQPGRKIVFIDELPWFDTRNSRFIQGLEHFWNSWASARNDILLIVCGSATSWMINKLINDKGGLHNRVTKKIKLLPFNLFECEKYLQSRKIALDRYQIIQIYMAFGGIPFYWDQLEPGLSATQNLQNICFSETGLLRTEFSNLYRSLFNNHERHVSIIKALAKKSKGLTREEIIAQSGLANAGSTTRLINELEESGFIRKYTPFGKILRNSLFQLVDFYTHFYLKFIEGTQPMDNNTWINAIDTPKYRAWSGYAYEQVCMYHLPQVKHALGISGVFATISSWRSNVADPGTQIDLIIDRRDQVINLCEIKFSINPVTITKKYASELRNQIGAFKQETQTRKSVFLTMITTFGLTQNMHVNLINNQLTMDDLFKPE